MKIVIFVNSLAAGGAERVTANLANYWAGKGWQVTIVTLAPKTSDFYGLHFTVRRVALGLDGNSTNHGLAILNNLKRAAALRRLIKSEKPNVVLAMMTTANILLSIATLGMRSVVTIGSERIHPPQYPLGPIWEFLRSCFYRRLTAMVALTQESARWLEKHAHPRNIVVIPNAASWPLEKMEPILAPPKKLSNERTLLAVGRLDTQKQFDHLISAFGRLAEDFPSWRLVILGEGLERATLEALVDKEGLNGRVLMPGRVGNVGCWYETADLYVMTSRFEGFPNTLVEAMAHGLAVVSYDCDTGPRDIIRHNVDGVIMPANDVKALEFTLRSLMLDEPLRQRFSRRAIEARERFSLAHVAGKWEELFEGAMASE